jgi:hypothetical protein
MYGDTNAQRGGPGGNSILGAGARGIPSAAGLAGRQYGGGGSGGSGNSQPTILGGAGAAGIIIVEEFY